MKRTLTGFRDFDGDQIRDHDYLCSPGTSGDDFYEVYWDQEEGEWYAAGIYGTAEIVPLPWLVENDTVYIQGDVLHGTGLPADML